MIVGGQVWIEYPSRKDEFSLWWTADWHSWSRGCAEDVLKRDIAEVAADSRRFWLHGGDYAEFIGYQDKRFDPEAFNPDIRVSQLAQMGYAQAKHVRDLMRPIKGQCIGLMQGNHEKKYMQQKDAQQLHGWLCTELGVPNLGYSCIFDIVFVRKSSTKRGGRILRKCPSQAGKNDAWRVRVFAHHGAGYAQTPGGKLNKLIQAMDYFPGADLVLLAHVHDKKAQRMPRLDANRDCTEIVAHDQVGAICGAYLRTYGAGAALYGEQKLYRPVSLGGTTIRFRPDKREMRVEI